MKQANYSKFLTAIIGLGVIAVPLYFFITNELTLDYFKNRVTQAAHDCCYQECPRLGDRRCDGNIAQECGYCDSDHFRDWCDAEDCSASGLGCNSGWCGIAPTCADGTVYGLCSSASGPPKYCDNSGNLVDNCAVCGCPAGADCYKPPGTACAFPCVPDGCNGNCPGICTAGEDPDCPGYCLDCTCPTDTDCAESCAAGDGCCPGCIPPDPDCDGCTPTLDCADYPGQCGNNLSNGCEYILDCSANCVSPRICCAGICRTSACLSSADCDDSNNCTTDVCQDENTCAAVCQNNPVTDCVNNDGCCPSGCTSASDSDCNDAADPEVITFDVNPRETTGSVTASYTVSDDTALNRAELWRTPDLNGQPDSGGWIQIGAPQTLAGTYGSGEFTDAPPAGVWWYGLHVVDASDNVGHEPDPPGPIKVIINESFGVTITNPEAGSEFSFNASVVFQGIAEGGTSPYNYSWSSDIDGFLGSGQTITIPE